jgi:hypothetical protein
MPRLTPAVQVSHCARKRAPRGGGRPRRQTEYRTVQLRLDKKELEKLDAYRRPGEKRASALRRWLADLPAPAPEREPMVRADHAELLEAFVGARAVA